MSKIEGMDVLVRKLEGLAAKARKNANAAIRVGYSADYAIFRS